MKTTAILATIILLATTPLAHAGVIFSDDFNRPHPSNSDQILTLGPPWVEHEVNATDVIVDGGRLFLGGITPSAQASDLSSLCLFGTMLSFDWGGVAAATGKPLQVLWSTDNSSFTDLAVLDLNSNNLNSPNNKPFE